ncbi:MAG TPA: TIGR04290 family methyltransferase, partial [Rhodanobacteraceae bacterium]|nr:TIGR04290 family methyltransferase [Rhodanobacteraceae bacterium]
VEFRRMQIYDLAREPERYDLVWFMGVLYHLRHPLLALDIVRRKVGRTLIVQTLTMPGEEVLPVAPEFALEERGAMLQPGWPKMAFIEHRMAGDPTNWWAPSHACVEAMLRASGFRVLGRIAHETYRCEPAEMDVQAASMIADELKAATGS